jgi:hypothetical protein
MIRNLKFFVRFMEINLDVTLAQNLRNVFFLIQCHHMSLMDFVVSLLIVAEV